MSQIIDMQSYLMEKSFKNEVVTFFQKINPNFQNFKDDNKAVFILNHMACLFVFMSFVPKKEQTSLPSLMDSFNNIKHKPRISKGEWVVEKIYELPLEKAVPMFREIRDLKMVEVVDFMKDKIESL